jgi:hydroxymethylpyrimidine/phosphomethylpyrimidine kinase
MDRSDAAGVTRRLPIALTLAGSDSGGGAGVQADLKTFASIGVYAATVVTALTAQNTRGVKAIHCSPPKIVDEQIEAVLEDFAIAAIKIGMLGSREIVNVVADRLLAELDRRRDPVLGAARPFIVYDPVMAASSGHALSGAGFVEAITHKLLPLVDCLTPNLAEAAALLGQPLARDETAMARQGQALLTLGPRAVLMKGGHLDGEEAIDLLVTEASVSRFAAPRLVSENLHGTGCTLSSAIAAHVVLGAALVEAVAEAKGFVRRAIEQGRGVTLGAGAGPLIQTRLHSKL